MSGIYGDLLAFFPELIEEYATFTMNPKPVAGFSARENEGTIRGILQFVKPGDLDFEVKTTVDVSYPTFWTYSRMLPNAYLIDASGLLYRRVKTNDWVRHGGFYIYVLESVAGVDGRQLDDTRVDGGVSRYA